MEAILAEKAETEVDTGYVCPHCGKRTHIPNAETRAAIEEGNAMWKEKSPGKTFDSFDELWNDLNA
jgi:hypothetical protein